MILSPQILKIILYFTHKFYENVILFRMGLGKINEFPSTYLFMEYRKNNSGNRYQLFL